MRKFCKQSGFDVALPAFEGDASQVRKTNQQLLASCDAVLLFYGAGDEAWKRTIDNELKKMAGYRAGKPLLARYTYLAEPGTSDKEDLVDMEEPGLINGLGRLRGGGDGRIHAGREAGSDVMSAAARQPQTNPFPGLRPFKEDEEHLFFGRENQVDAWSTSWPGRASWPSSALRAAANPRSSTAGCGRRCARA